MTKLSRTVIAVALLGTVPLAAQAEGFWQSRASFSLGNYTYEESSADSDGPIIAADVGAAYGLKLQDGSTAVFDVELEAMTIDAEGDVDLDFERTDLKASAGWVLDVGLNLTPFVGLRYAWQGDGYFDDDFYTETGFLVGVGLSGIKLGDNLSLAGSLAYNDTELEAGSAEADASGFSFRASLRPKGSAIGYSLKYQTFDVEDDLFNEDYLLVSATWYFAQGKL